MHTDRRRSNNTVALLVSAALLVGACGSTPPPTGRPSAPTTPTESGSSSSIAGSTVSPPGRSASPATIEQPLLPPGLKVAPDSARVDLVMPTFTNPTKVTNPLFPVSQQHSVLMLGRVDDKPFRTEVTLLPFTRIVVWAGRPVETLVSQYCAYLDGRIQEIAYDLYAQADDGSVWYFGEDVADFEDGAIVSKEGTWLAGKDAPAAMIMPGQPKVGDVFRTENSPGFAFEEVTIKAVGQTVPGPLRPVTGGLIVSELHMDASREDKTFAPGYGEFLTSGGGDVEALALAVPTDAAAGAMPGDVEALRADAMHVLSVVGGRQWNEAERALGDMSTRWAAVRAGGVPRLIEPRLAAAMSLLGRAVERRQNHAARQRALAVANLALDLQLRYRPAVEVDLRRLDLWAAQLEVDASRREAATVNGDVFTLVYIRDRVLGGLSQQDRTSVDEQIQALQVAAADEAFVAATRSARRLRSILGAVTVTP